MQLLPYLLSDLKAICATFSDSRKGLGGNIENGFNEVTPRKVMRAPAAFDLTNAGAPVDRPIESGALRHIEPHCDAEWSVRDLGIQWPPSFTASGVSLQARQGISQLASGPLPRSNGARSAARARSSWVSGTR